MHTIRKVKKNEIGDVIEFNAREYGPAHILTDPKYLEWQFSDFEDPGSEDLNILGLFSASGILMGIFGYFDSRALFFGREARCRSLCNLIVKKELRMLGYGYRLLEAASEFGGILIDHGLNADAWKMFEKAGWKGGEMKRHFFIFDGKKTKELIGDSNAAIKESPRLKMEENEFSSERVERFDRRIEEFSVSVKDRYPITLLRSPRYCNWRYADHPFFRYHSFIVKKNGVLSGFWVIRTEEPEGRFKVAHLVDCMAAEGAELHVFAKAVEFCRSQRADWMDYFSSGAFHEGALNAAGFFRSDEGSYGKIPMLLNPVDRTKRTKINFMVLNGDPELRKMTEADSAENWYTTKAGGDQDRPN